MGDSFQIIRQKSVRKASGIRQAGGSCRVIGLEARATCGNSERDRAAGCRPLRQARRRPLRDFRNRSCCVFERGQDKSTPL
jgi:hypothetical protein